MDGKPLPVYGVVVEDVKILGYIETEEGKTYTIHCHDLRVSSGGHDWHLSAFIDGSKCVRTTGSLDMRVDWQGNRVLGRIKAGSLLHKGPGERRRFTEMTGLETSDVGLEVLLLASCTT